MYTMVSNKLVTKTVGLNGKTGERKSRSSRSSMKLQKSHGKAICENRASTTDEHRNESVGRRTESEKEKPKREKKRFDFKNGKRTTVKAHVPTNLRKKDKKSSKSLEPTRESKSVDSVAVTYSKVEIDCDKTPSQDIFERPEFQYGDLEEIEKLEEAEETEETEDVEEAEEVEEREGTEDNEEGEVNDDDHDNEEDVEGDLVEEVDETPEQDCDTSNLGISSDGGSPETLESKFKSVFKIADNAFFSLGKFIGENSCSRPNFVK
jgi:hypothetical protein